MSPPLPNMADIREYYLAKSCFLLETFFFVPPLSLFQKQWSTYHSSLELKQNFVPHICCSADIALPRFLVHYFEHFWAHFLNKNIVCSVNCRLYLCTPSPPLLIYAGSTSAFWRSLQNLRNGWAPCAASLANGLNKVENEQAYVANTHRKQAQGANTGSEHTHQTYTVNRHSEHTQWAREKCLA